MGGRLGPRIISSDDTALPAVTVPGSITALNSYTAAAGPTSAGVLWRCTDEERGIWTANGSTAYPIGKYADIRDFNAVCDGVTDDSQAVMDALLSPTNPSVVFIPPNTVWDYTADPGDALGTIQSRHPDEVAIIDDSGWDWNTAVPRFSGIQQVILSTNDPGNADGHHRRLVAGYHPAQIIDVNSQSSDAQINASTGLGKASTLWRRDGENRWLAGLFAQSNVIDMFRLSSFIVGHATPEIQHLVILYDHSDPRVNFGYGPTHPAGYPFVFYNRGDARALTFGLVSNENGAANDQAVIHDYFAGTISAGTRLYKEVVYAAGGPGKGAVYEYDQNNVLRRGITGDFEGFGDRRSTVATTNGTKNIDANYESGMFFTNAAAGGAVTFKLPAAVAGLQFRFTVLAAQSLEVDPQDTEVLRANAAGHKMSSNAVGDWAYVWCVATGVWEFQRGGPGGAAGSWVDE